MKNVILDNKAVFDASRFSNEDELITAAGENAFACKHSVRYKS